MKLGDIEIRTVSDGTFRLDGGAMFGIVPKPAWEKLTDVDAQNRILLSLNCLLIRTGKHTLLVDTGIGTKHNSKFMDLYDIRHFTTVPQSLREIGLSADDIDTVIISHLHFDHAGGATVRYPDGSVKPTYPRARYVIQEGMWAEALDPNPRTKGSYLHDDFVPLEKQGRVQFVKGDAEIVPGVRVHLSGGHVKHHQVVFVESGGRKAIYWGDLLPTTNHIRPAWVMGYDLFPHEAAAKKVEMVDRAVKEEWVCVFEHDPVTSMGIIRIDGKGFRVESMEAARRAK